jgi:hypothetical protein
MWWPFEKRELKNACGEIREKTRWGAETFALVLYIKIKDVKLN